MKVLAFLAVVIVLCAFIESGPHQPDPAVYDELYYSGEKIEE